MLKSAFLENFPKCNVKKQEVLVNEMKGTCGVLEIEGRIGRIKRKQSQISRRVVRQGWDRWVRLLEADRATAVITT